MAQFIAYANGNPASRRRVPYVLDVQSDLIDTMGSRVMIPLIAPERAGHAIKGLMPRLDIAGEVMVMDTAQIASVPRRVIGMQVADLSDQRPAIMAALDMLISGI